MKLKNYIILLFFAIFTTSIFAQSNNLIVKGIYNESAFASVNNSDYYFTIVEFQVLNTNINLSDYKLKYNKGDGSNDTNRDIGNFSAKKIDSYSGGNPNLTNSNGNLSVGDSYYCVEMQKIGNSGYFGVSNQTMYKVFADYFQFSEADMINNKYFTTATTGSENFDTSIHNSGSKISIREKNSSGNFVVIDVWEGGLTENNSTVRTTLTPSNTYDSSQWDGTLSVNNDDNNFENKFIQNPIASGDVLMFRNTMLKEIKIYDVSGSIKLEKVVNSSLIIPEHLNGIYFLRINSQKGTSVHKLIVE